MISIAFYSQIKRFFDLVKNLFTAKGFRGQTSQALHYNCRYSYEKSDFCFVSYPVILHLIFQFTSNSMFGKLMLELEECTGRILLFLDTAFYYFLRPILISKRLKVLIWHSFYLSCLFLVYYYDLSQIYIIIEYFIMVSSSITFLITCVFVIVFLA